MKDRRTDCWIRRKQNMIRNNPTRASFRTFCTVFCAPGFLILKAHVPSKKVNLRARWREIYCKMYLRTKRNSIAIVVYLLFCWRWPNRPSVVFLQGPIGKRDKHVEKTQLRSAGLRKERTEIRDTAGALQTFSGKRKLAKTLLRIRLTKN